MAHADTAKFIARLVGPVLAVSGVAMLANADTYRTLIEEFLKSEALVYLAGFLALLGGLAIVNVHNSWNWGWRLIITVFGWLAIIGGILRMTVPQFAQALGAAVYDRAGVVAAVGLVTLALGGFLSFKGYSA
jgi:uncharacterized membrane protein